MPNQTPQFSNLLIETLIIHEIPQALAAQKEEHLSLSAGAAPVGQDELNFFRERVTQSLDGHGVASRFSDTAQSPVPASVMALLADGAALVPESQAIATYLYQQQPGNSPEGLLAVMLGRVDQDKAIAVMKLQKQAGLQVTPTTTASGQPTLTVEILDELMLTDRTRVFKVAVFLVDSDGVLHGTASDEQLGSNASGGVAAFFMNTLGCVPAESPAVLTKRFFDEVGAFINESVSDDATKLRYAEALRTEIASHVAAIEPSRFIAAHIDPPDRDHLEAHLRDRDVPLAAFPKDAQGVQPRLNRRTLRTRRGVSVRGEAGTFTELVTVQEFNGRNAVIIHDDVAEV